MSQICDNHIHFNNHNFKWLKIKISYLSAPRVKGLVKLKKIKKSYKNSEVGGWVKPQLGFFFLKFCVFVCFVCVVFMLPIVKKSG